MADEGNVLIKIVGLKKHFPVKRTILGKPKTYLKAVDGISFEIKQGETLGLVGESGCGKSTVARCIVRLYDITDGQIFFEKKEIGSLPEKELSPYRKKIQMIFQDPFASLNGRMTIQDIISEPLDIHGIGSRKQRLEKVSYLLDRVGLSREHAGRYPHEFSGGQRQRIGIARAIAMNPSFIICDEPISALDVSIQAQIINMLEDLQEEFGLTFLFIAHDLSMVRHISKRMGIMYLGKLVELADSTDVCKLPLHPYTQALLSAVPVPDPVRSSARSVIELEGELPSPLSMPLGCRFHTRCRHAEDICRKVEPVLKERNLNHFVSCHLVDQWK